MQTYYSILFVPIRPAINEQISIGLLLTNKEQAYSHFSKQKLEIAKRLLPQGGQKLLGYSVELMDAYLKKGTFQKESGKAKGEQTTIDLPYIEYLSRYNNNLLIFSPPIPIDIEATEENFWRLYADFVDTQKD